MKPLRNGLPQGSVLCPILFNVYTADIPKTTSRKFIYAEDVGKSFEGLETILGKDLVKLKKYFDK